MPQFAVKDIRPNPFRHIERYPIRAEKVAALRESYRATGFWGNIVARVVDGKPEIAYGHHRLAALKAELGADTKVDLIVQDLDDETMLQIMARENMEEWGTSASVEQETIRAVVEAYAEGLIELNPVPSKTPSHHIRHAPSFATGDVPRARAEHPYTAQTLADFLGWVKPDGKPQSKILDALAALQFIDEGVLGEDDFEGLSTKQAEAVVQQARRAQADRETLARHHERQAQEAAVARERAEKERLAAEERERKAADREEARRAVEQRKEAAKQEELARKRQAHSEQESTKARTQGQKAATRVGRTVSKELRGGSGYKQARQIADRVMPVREEKPPPMIEAFARRLATDIYQILRPDHDQRVRKLDELVKHRAHLSERQREDLARTLEGVGERFSEYAEKLRQPAGPKRVSGQKELTAGGR